MPLTHKDYTVAWVCALSVEAAAAKVILEKTHPQLPQLEGVYGTTSAAQVVAQMQRSFPSIHFALLVGVGGGVPSRKHDIRLGDVVVSQPTDKSGGVVQYDYGKTIDGKLQRTSIMNQPPLILLNAMARLQSGEVKGRNQKVTEVVLDILNTNDEIKAQFSRPAEEEEDRLFHAAYNHHRGEETCVNCNKKILIPRYPRRPEGPRIHYGVIASGNQVIKDGQTRDRLAKELGTLCLEMEAAGVMNQIPCLVIRGVSDYSDSHKTHNWHGYAALTAAVYAKVLLSIVPVNRPRKEEPSRKAPWMVPFERNPRFLGHEKLILELKQAIFQGGVRKMAVAGLGGIGKTQIALELAYQVRNEDPEYSIFWISSISQESIEQAFLSISGHLGLQDVSSTELKSRVKTYLSSEKAGRWLLIVDNADDMEMWTSQLKSFLPYSKYGFIFFTTRNQQLAIKLVGPEVIALTEMSEEMAMELLRVSLIQKHLVDDYDITAQLLHQLCYLPLAIVQAASYVNENQISLESYLSLLQDQENVLVELLSLDFEDEWRYTEIHNPVAVTWLVSFRQIQRLNLVATNYLSFMSCIHPRGIPQSLLPSPKSPVQRQAALGLLKAYSFITGEDNDRFFHLHRLVHLATRNWLRAEGRLTKWTTQATRQLNKVFPRGAHENRVLWRQYMPHAQYLLQSEELQIEIEEKEDFLQNVGGCLYYDGKYAEAEVIFRDILNWKRERFPENHVSVLTSMSWMSLVLWSQNKLEEAEQLYRKVMEAKKMAHGPKHLDTLTSMGNFAATLRNQGRWAEAEELEIHVMETRKAILGPKHLDTLGSMDNLAATIQCQGRLAEAEKLQLEVMEARKTILGPKHPDTINIVYALASTFHKQGRLVEAEKLQIEVVEARKAVLGPKHPDTLDGIDYLAVTYRNQGRWAEAEQLEMQIVEIRKATLGPNHPNTLINISNLASTISGQGRFDEAEQLYRQLAETRKGVLGAQHQTTLSTLANLSESLRHQGRLAEAEQLEIEVMETRKTLLGPRHPYILISMANLASTFQSQGLWVEAEELNLEVLEIRKAVLGLNHPSTLVSMTDTAAIFRNQGRLAEAEQLYREVIKISKEVIGVGYPSAIICMWHLSCALRQSGRHSKAVSTLKSSIKLQHQYMTSAHPYTIQAEAALKMWEDEDEDEDADADASADQDSSLFSGRPTVASEVRLV